jgi:hypothetical protein
MTEIDGLRHARVSAFLLDVLTALLTTSFMSGGITMSIITGDLGGVMSMSTLSPRWDWGEWAMVNLNTGT